MRWLGSIGLPLLERERKLSGEHASSRSPRSSTVEDTSRSEDAGLSGAVGAVGMRGGSASGGDELWPLRVGEEGVAAAHGLIRASNGVVVYE